MRIFAESDLSAVLEGQRLTMLREIEGEPPNKLLNVNESDFVQYLADKYHVEPIVFNFEALQVSHSEKLIPVEQHPFNSGARFSHFRKEAYPRQVITFHLPFSGDPNLLKCRPSSWITWSTDIAVAQGEVRFDLINWQNDAEQLKREQNEIIDRIRKQNENVTKDVANFNSHLGEHARQAMSGRKAQLLKQSSLVESDGGGCSRAGVGH